jgi:hypothetical protein
VTPRTTYLYKKTNRHAARFQRRWCQRRGCRRLARHEIVRPSREAAPTSPRRRSGRRRRRLGGRRRRRRGFLREGRDLRGRLLSGAPQSALRVPRSRLGARPAVPLAPQARARRAQLAPQRLLAPRLARHASCSRSAFGAGRARVAQSLSDV